MAKAPKSEIPAAAPGVDAEIVTAPPLRDAQNRLIDADGVPIGGPARAKALAKYSGAKYSENTDQLTDDASSDVTKKDDA
jgi:hypothetical protein